MPLLPYRGFVVGKLRGNRRRSVLNGLVWAIAFGLLVWCCRHGPLAISVATASLLPLAFPLLPPCKHTLHGVGLWVVVDHIAQGHFAVNALATAFALGSLFRSRCWSLGGDHIERQRCWCRRRAGNHGHNLGGWGVGCYWAVLLQVRRGSSRGGSLVGHCRWRWRRRWRRRWRCSGSGWHLWHWCWRLHWGRRCNNKRGFTRVACHRCRPLPLGAAYRRWVGINGRIWIVVCRLQPFRGLPSGRSCSAFRVCRVFSVYRHPCFCHGPGVAPSIGSGCGSSCGWGWNCVCSWGWDCGSSGDGSGSRGSGGSCGCYRCLVRCGAA
eukprot:m.317310 g.317310  ORF g.317310 m.317310 type:complete len:323 (-) comp19687_c0_seq1:184-1152(-)